MIVLVCMNGLLNFVDEVLYYCMIQQLFDNCEPRCFKMNHPWPMLHPMNGPAFCRVVRSGCVGSCNALR